MSNSAQTSASNRINALLDENSFVEVGAYVTARSTDFNMTDRETPADGVVTGYGTIEGCLVYVYSQDASVLGGSMGEMHAKKISNIYSMAVKMGAPVKTAGGNRCIKRLWPDVFKSGYGFWRCSADFRSFWYLRRRYGSILCNGRFCVYGEQKGKTVCKFSQCN